MSATLEQRVRRLEDELSQLKRRLDEKPAKPWWEEIAGKWAGNPAFDEAMRLGRQYRESLKPKPKRRKSAKRRNGHPRH